MTQVHHTSRVKAPCYTLLRRCSEKGATLVLVRDKGGHVFGGFAAAPWLKHGSFFGSFENFLFSLLPAVAIYRPSGVNQNFQFCGQNFTQVPNGEQQRASIVVLSGPCPCHGMHPKVDSA